MKCKLLLVLLAAFVCLEPACATDAPSASSSTSAPGAADAHAKVEAFLQSLHPVSGEVAIPEAQATLQLKPGYGYLQAADAQRVLTKLWNNPPDEKVLGMILPSTDPATVVDGRAWAVVVTYVDDGYVSDQDASKIDYDDLLKSMQKATQDENEARVKQGYPSIELVGWAEPPHYDAASHKLYWARDLAIRNPDGSSDGHTLNYAIRVLGRRGYLSLNAVAPIDELDKVRADMPAVLAMADFNEGQRYADYDAKTDKLAAYGIAALIAGGIAAKAGLFAKLGIMLLALKKFVIVGVAAVAAAIRKLFKRKQ
ncbi:DUF2167 domain-containing protein [Rhodanobacter sp. 7MK24]|uniref:DUF2167 domain-containing protein n=1 Tax=Rhodanobacter sp. 7MK24 TaxID=2775922 RepID=UPI0017802F92|nr:DUF2167 domain-containing protein [Rhodanobacter sp. 7MK24]MBD8881847.1 DUF2167 domain-containing protein [Rhodanobacter sp. 7MK24]